MLYEYTLSLELEDEDFTAISEMKVTYGDKESTCKLNVQHKEIKLNQDDHERLSSDSLSITDMNISDFIDGSFEIENLNFSVNDDLELKDVYFLGNETSKIEEIRINDGDMDYILDTKDGASLSAKDNIIVSIKGQDDTLKNFTSCNRYLVFKYECGGKEYETYIDIQFRTRLDRYEMFAFGDETINYRELYINRNAK